MQMQKELGDNITHDAIKESLWKTLKSGQVVPGYETRLSGIFIRILTALSVMATVSLGTRIRVSWHCSSSVILGLRCSRIPSSN